MGLRAQAAADLQAIIQDSDAGFGWPIWLTDPDGTRVSFVGFATDIAQTIDPQTGIPVAGRTASIALRIASLTAAGMGIPRGVADKKEKPWVIEVNDVDGKPHVFKVIESLPDRAIGLVVCMLEAYKK